MTDNDLKAIQPIIENCGGLIDDAILLVKAERYPRAFALNVLALEELGKAIQLRWKQLGVTTTRQKRSAHIQKQMAVACLLIAEKVLPFYRRFFAGEVSQPVMMVELATAFINSDERRFFERVAAIELDRSKQVGFYHDDVTVATHSRDEIDAAFTLQLSQTLAKAMPLLKSEIAVQVAGIFYEIMPQFADQILVDRNAY